MHALSTEYVHVPIRADHELAEGTAVEFAFTPGDLAPSSWLPASSFVLDADRMGGKASLLVGPETTTALAAGSYRVHVRITDNPERPVLTAGRLIVTD